MTERQTITIRLKPWLQEFLTCSLADPGVASKKNIIGALITPFLEYIPKDMVVKPVNGEDYFTFELPDHIAGKNPKNATMFISEENQRNFERILDLYFKNIFFNYVDDKIRYKNEYKKVIYEFCADYNLSFNKVSYETLKKAYYRRSKKQEKSLKNSAKQSLRCPSIFLL